MDILKFAINFLAATTLFSSPIRVPVEYHDTTGLKRSVINKPSPFISYLQFRDLCDHIIDHFTPYFDPACVQKGDLIYLNLWFLEWFSKNVHPCIQHPYILITCDVLDYVPRPEIKNLLYDPKCAAWFCRNIIFSNHPKIFQIPMGSDWALFAPDGYSTFSDICISQIEKGPESKEHLLYLNFLPRPEGKRDTIARFFENKEFCLSRFNLPTAEYFKDIAQSNFVLSPIGLEMDTVRTWESLVLGAIPVVEHTFLDPLFEEMPVLIIDEWESLTPAFLDQKYNELKCRPREKALFAYWKNLIHEAQERVKESHFPSDLEETAMSPKDLEDLAVLLKDSPHLFYKGALTAIRPLQVASFCPFLEQIWVYDPYLDPETFATFNQYLTQSYLLHEKSRIHVVKIPFICDGPQTLFNELLAQTPPPYTVFLDLTHYRQGLITDFTSEFRKPHNLLKRDLIALLNRLPLFTCLIGNEIDNPFVRRVVERVALEKGVPLETVGSFWKFNNF